MASDFGPQLDSNHRAPRALASLRLQNFLSFDDEGTTVELGPLNVLIGPNGSGKSNLLEALALLRKAPTDFTDVFTRGGGAREFIWKGAPNAPASLIARFALDSQEPALEHAVEFRITDQQWSLSEERVRAVDSPESSAFYRQKDGRATIRRSASPLKTLVPRLDVSRSILAQRRDPDAYPALEQLSSFYEGVRLYRTWTFGRDSVLRIPQKADLRTDRLEEDFSNLALFLKRICRQPRVKRQVLGRLADLYDGLTDFDASIEGGTVQLFLVEGDFTVPAPRLSDGTVRYLCLLAILCDPSPPPLICIDEPELGLHPDLIPKVADLLREAAARTQLIVTTHSDILIDAFTDVPDVVVVAERTSRGSSLQRLASKELGDWLKQYRLGELWLRGQVGGTRW